MALAVALALMLSACGSTDRENADDSRDADPQGIGGSSGVGIPEDLATQTPGSRGEASESLRHTTTTPSTEGATNKGARGIEIGQGITASKILIGFHGSENTNAAITALGLHGTSRGDDRLLADAVIEYINAHGGMAGRKVELVVHSTDTASGTFASQAQQACARFTEDNKVFAVASVMQSMGHDLISCLARHKTPLALANYEPFDQHDFDRHAGFFYDPGNMNQSRLDVYIHGLAEQGFFSTGSRIGLIRYDTAEQVRVREEAIKPALAEHGLKLHEEFAINKAESVAGFGGVANEASSAVLRFSGRGINRVLFITDTAPALFFMSSAESQGYRPRYGLQSLLVMEPQISKNVPEAQFKGARGVGWWPTNDVPVDQDPGRNPAKSLCMEIMRKAGHTFPDRNAERAATSVCDTLFFFKSALDKARDLTPAGLRRAIESMGGQFNSPRTFATRFGRGRHDGTSVVRNFAFDDGCSCFRYVGSPRRLS